MKPELEKRLVEKYPQIFRDIGGDPRRTPMAFGIECGDGWYDLIDKCCEKIMATNPLKDFRAMQVKEKFGGLRFYVSSASDEIHNIIDEVEDESYKTCEKCGSHENTNVETDGWFITLCDKCMVNYKKDIV